MIAKIFPLRSFRQIEAESIHILKSHTYVNIKTNIYEVGKNKSSNLSTVLFQESTRANEIHVYVAAWESLCFFWNMVHSYNRTTHIRVVTRLWYFGTK